LYGRGRAKGLIVLACQNNQPLALTLHRIGFHRPAPLF